jgi:D-alanyl-D-alanine carboxypeptidase/D-alanyl-D-alanine-endopeptidase (penicillin-binding protein 4)
MMQENKNRIKILKLLLPVAKYEDGNYARFRLKNPLFRPFRFGGQLFLLWHLCAWAGSSTAVVKPQSHQDSVRVALAKDPVQTRLEAFLTAHNYSRKKVGILVTDVESDSVIASLNADSMYNPASVSKLVTAAMAFDRLGTNYAFKTSVYTDRKVTADSGICRGNLYIRGGGDPYFVIERMWLFVQHLVCSGLKTINGDIVLDDSFFDTVSVGPGFDEDDSSHPYEAPTGALTANFNCVSVWERPAAHAGAPLLADILPKSSLIKLVVSGKTDSAGKPSNCTASSQKDGGKTVVTVGGTMPVDTCPVIYYKKVWQTWEYFGNILMKLFEDNKILVKGRLVRGVLPDSIKARPPFYVFNSVPLYQAVNSMMKVSNNYMAELIFKTLSAERDSTFGSWEKSSALALAWWKEKNLPMVPKIKNGSGMGDSNKMSARQITGLLRHVWDQKVYLPEYLYSLPCAGVDGTLKSRFKKSRLKGMVRAKTGTLNDYGVSTIAGYAFLRNKTYVFSVMFNQCNSRTQFDHWEMQEKLLEMALPE